MKKIVTALTLVLFSVIALSAQEEKSPFRLELSTQSIFVLDDIANGQFGFGTQRVGNPIGYALHLSAFRELGKRLDFGVGFGFANRDAFTVCYCQFCDKLLPIEGDYTRLRSLEIPIEFRVKWFKEERRFQPYFSLGATTKIPLNYQRIGEEWQVEIDNSRLLIGVNFNLGTQISLNSKWSLVVAASLTAQDLNLDLSGDQLSRPGRFTQRTWEEWALKLGGSRNF